ncbi:putative Sister chromatid cohesion 1 protein [Quillaja saponaria]|nr:putative Sister chromatid cohesion 1 protein [Quillaja saponaria]
MAYLLLGVVRIYSKKVEYLFHDCNEVLAEIKKFVAKTKENAHMETLRASFHSITLPDRFELDAFDLDILEDVGGGNTVHHEAITLKDGSWNEGIGQCSLVKFQSEEFEDCPNTCSSDYTMVEDVIRSHFMDIDFEISTPYSPINSHLRKQKLTQEPANVSMVPVVEEEFMDPVNFFGEEHQTNEEEIEVPEKTEFEDHIHGDVSMEKLQCCRISEEESVDIKMLCWREEEPLVHVKPFNKNNQIDGVNALELPSSENKTHQVIGEASGPRGIEKSMEGLQDDMFYEKECLEHDTFSSAEREPPEIVRLSVEEHRSTGKSEFQNVTLNENGNCADIVPKLTALDDFFPDAAGVSTPEFMVIPTPAARERPRFSKKRKCIFDELTVLPNEVLRKSIHDASDLINIRRKCPHTLLAAWRASCIPSLPQGFFESLIPCHSIELHCLFSQRNLTISESVGTRKTPEKLDVSDSPNVGPLAEIHSVFSRKKFKIPASFGTVETLEKLDVSDSPNVGRSEQLPIAPETPLQYSTIRLTERPEIPKSSESHKVRPDLFESIEKEQSARKDEELNDILTNQETNSYETENPTLNGWSGRTGVVARYLHSNFIDLRKQRKKEVVNLLPVLEGQTKKKSARLFYELLVLRTTGYVDVKQDNAYGDISVQKLTTWDQTFAGCLTIEP